MTEEARAKLVPGKEITKAVSLLEPLSSGGMGAVWLADHRGLKTRVVVKFMLVGLDSSESARIRFSREAAAAAQVKSPHVVQMLDHGVSDEGVPFIVMEHLEGHDLGEEIEKQGALEPGKVVAIVSQVAKALSKVHAAGLLHRDIKPDNIFLCAGEEDIFVKLLDFGIAKSSAVNDDNGDGSLDGETKTGQIVGTPFYMSPEQVTAQKTIDHRSDLWALGVVAYQALTGQRPYDGPSFGALAVKIATGSPPRMTEANPALPPSVDAWFAKACAQKATDRFASAKEMSDAFRAAFEGVVSLPASVLSSDSGQRSGTHRTPTPNEKAAPDGLGLAATALDDSDAARKHVSLGRSEAGVSVVGNSMGARSSPVLRVAGAVLLTVVVAGVIVWSARQPRGAVMEKEGAAQPVAATSKAPAEPLGTPKLATTAIADAASLEPVSVRDAAAITPIAPTGPRPSARPTGHTPSAPVPTQSAKPEPTTKPTAKPTSSEPDLF